MTLRRRDALITHKKRGSLRSSTPGGSRNPPRDQVNLSYINEMSPFRQAQEQGKQPLIDWGRRDQFYRLTPHLDSDESMRTDPGQLRPQRLRDPIVEPTRQGTPLQDRKRKSNPKSRSSAEQRIIISAR